MREPFFAGMRLLRKWRETDGSEDQAESLWDRIAPLAVRPSGP